MSSQFLCILYKKRIFQCEFNKVKNDRVEIHQVRICLWGIHQVGFHWVGTLRVGIHLVEIGKRIFSWRIFWSCWYLFENYEKYCELLSINIFGTAFDWNFFPMYLKVRLRKSDIIMFLLPWKCHKAFFWLFYNVSEYCLIYTHHFHFLVLKISKYLSKNRKKNFFFLIPVIAVP